MAPLFGGSAASVGHLILQGAARSWMIFAIVWGSIVFIAGRASPRARSTGIGNHNSGVVQYDAVHRGGLSPILGSDADVPVNLTDRLHGGP